MDTDRIKGVMVPMLTPLTPDEKVDIQSTKQLVDYLINNGVHGIWAAGTNGEFAALTQEQRVIITTTIVESVAGRVPVIGNASMPATKLTIDLAREIQDCGLDGIAATPPYYYSCSQSEITNHFEAIRNQIRLPLWVYNIPRTVKTPVEPDTMYYLAKNGVISGVKDSSGGGEDLARLIVLCNQNSTFLYKFLGSTYRTINTAEIGVHGVIPGLGNLVPNFFSAAWEAGQKGNSEISNRYMKRIIDAEKELFLAQNSTSIGGGVSGMKAALKAMGIIEHDVVTAPFRSLDENEQKVIPYLLNKLGLPEA